MDILWIEKYRPRSLDEMVITEERKSRFIEIIQNPTTMPHLLFIGPPGSGKTTISRILIKNIIKHDSDVLTLNGSDQRGIDVFRSIIPDFLSTVPLFSPVKIVFIDEADNLTSDAKKAFRALIERYSYYGRFIMTANDDTFTAPIKSRFEITRMVGFGKDKTLEYCRTILNSENVQYEDSDLERVVDLFYPDIRRIVGTLQQYTVDSVFTLKEIKLDSDTIVINQVIDIIKCEIRGDQRNSNILSMSVCKYVTQNYVDILNVLKILFDRIPFTWLPIKIVIAKNANAIPNCVSTIMLFYIFLNELREEVQKYRSILDVKQLKTF